MQQADEITLKAFLIALEQSEAPLGEAEQRQLQEIAGSIENHLGLLDAIAQNNPKLDELYQKIRSALANNYVEDGAIASDREALFSYHLTYESRKILNINGVQISHRFKDFINKIHLKANYQLRNPLEKDPECLVGLSRDELEALAESILSISKQEQLSELLSKNSEAQLSPQETISLDNILAQIDKLMILKTRARYTLEKLEEKFGFIEPLQGIPRER